MVKPCLKSLRRLVSVLLGMACTGLLWPSGTSAQDATWYPVIKPTYFYTPSGRFGVGLGFQGLNVLRPEDEARARFRLQQYHQFLAFGWSRHAPSPRRKGVMATFRASRNLREGYYGVGAKAAPGNERLLHRNWVDAEVRLGVPLGRRFWLQPRLSVRTDNVINVGRPQDAPQPGVPIEAGLDRLATAGLDVGLSPFDGGLVQGYVYRRLLDADRHQTVGGLALFVSKDLGRGRSLHARVMVDRTFARSTDLPYHVLPLLDMKLSPGLDRFRFYGNDRFVAGASFVQPLVSVLRSHVIQGIATITLAQVYDDMLKDFDAAVRIAPDRSRFDGAIPLEPTVAVGIRIRARRSGSILAAITVGLAAEGIEATNFRLQQRLAEWHSPVR